MKYLEPRELSREFKFGIVFSVIGVVLLGTTITLKLINMLNDGFYGGFISLSIELLLIGIVLMLGAYIIARRHRPTINCEAIKNLADWFFSVVALLLIMVGIVGSILHLTMNSPLAIALVTLTSSSFFIGFYIYGHMRRYCAGKS
ncbi:MAG: hypothetical protein ACP5GY_00285 [Vulcanisaeta sp.]